MKRIGFLVFAVFCLTLRLSAAESSPVEAPVPPAGVEETGGAAEWQQQANETDPNAVLQEGLGLFGADLLEDETPGAAEDFAERSGAGELTLASIFTLSPKDLFHAVLKEAKNALQNAKGGLFAIFGTVLLCGLLDCLTLGDKQSPVGSVFETASVLAITASITSPVVSCIEGVSATIVDCSMFLLSYVPVMGSILTAGGMPMTAASYCATLMFAVQLIAQAASSVLIPLCGIFLALSLAAGLADSPGLLGIADAAKSAATWILTFSMTVFVALLSLQTFLSGSADSVSVKATKFLIGSFVPVVGSALSDALSAAQGSIHLIKTTVGSFGILVTAFTFLPILLQTALLRLVLALASGSAELLGAKPVCKVIKAFQNVLSILCALILSMALLVVVSTAVLLTLGVGR